jgi:hypothetical protein
MSTPLRLWQKYRPAVYGPGPLPAVMEKGLRQAFLAGAFESMMFMRVTVQKATEDEAMAVLEQFFDAITQAIVDEMPKGSVQ